MDIEQALEATNPLGRVQVLILIAGSLVYMEISFLLLSNVFLAETPPHHCKVATGDTLNERIPIDKDGLYARCEEYVNSSGSKEIQSCSNGWDYDTELFGESITSEWNLVCSKDYLPDLSQSILVAGIVAGAIIAGLASDKYGRRPTILVSVVITNILFIAISFSPNYATFVSLRCALGISFKVINIPVTNMMFECLLPKHRSTFGNIPQLTGALALMLMAGLAALVKDWFYFNLVMMTPMFILMLFSWFLPESVRWQIAQGRIEKAEKTIQRMAKFNKAKDLTSPIFTVKPKIVPIGNAEADVIQEAEKKTKKRGGIDLLFKPPTAIVTIITSWLTFSFTIVYFGFALTTGSLAGDPYLNFFLSSLVEVPARLTPLFILKRVLQRKTKEDEDISSNAKEILFAFAVIIGKNGTLRPLLVAFFASGVTMVGIIITKSIAGSPDWLLTTLALLGKFLITFVFGPIILLTTELFPTTVRNSGMGVVHLIGNTGSLLSPLLLYMDKYVSNLSLMTVTSFVSAALCLFLPETLNTIQPETPADLKVLFETKRIFTFGKRSPTDSMSLHDRKTGLEGDETIDGDMIKIQTNEGYEPKNDIGV